MPPRLIFLLAIILGSGSSVIAVPQSESLMESLIQNGSFEEWKDELPVGWSVTPGIFNGAEQPLSKIRLAADGSIEISGNKRTLAWNIVSQSIPVKAGESYRLTFAARAKGLKREGNQFDNCHVGFWFKDAGGKTVSNQIEWIDGAKFKDYQINVTVPKSVQSADVSLTLSKTGTLFVKDVKLASLSDANSFDFLVDAMNKNYSYFEHKDIDLEKLAGKYRDKANAAKNNNAFTEVIADMFAEMKDGHLWVMRNGKRYAKYSPPFKINFHFGSVDKEFKYSKKIGRFAVVAITKDGFGYVRITSLYEIPEKDINELKKAIGKLAGTPGVIIDLRNNGGGAEPTAQSIAGLFADKEYVYAKQKVREGGGFSDVYERKLTPAKKSAYTKPMVCLIGSRAISSGEGMALMFKALDHCLTVGQPTRGSSGNPSGVNLPNGVEVWFSRWIAMEADGTPIEDRGVVPDVEVEHDPNSDGDPTYEQAIEWLKEKTTS